jgi:uncharacterized protein with GYD domain
LIIRLTQLCQFIVGRFSDTLETWALLMKNPEDHREAARNYIESVGGKLHGFWYMFVTHDGYNRWEAPDNVWMAALLTGAAAVRRQTPSRVFQGTVVEAAAQ